MQNRCESGADGIVRMEEDSIADLRRNTVLGSIGRFFMKRYPEKGTAFLLLSKILWQAGQKV